jgi:fluoride exporter
MGFAIPQWENRLTVFSADNSYLVGMACTRPAGRSFMNTAYLWVALGGALGSMARFWINGLVSMRFGETFPWGILVINVTGSFVIGILAALTAPDSAGPYRVTMIQFLMTGICGGYTTFSSFSLLTLNLLRDREWLYAGANIVLSVVLCLIAVWLGWLLGSAFNSLKGS